MWSDSADSVRRTVWSILRKAKSDVGILGTNPIRALSVTDSPADPRSIARSVHATEALKAEGEVGGVFLDRLWTSLRTE